MKAGDGQPMDDLSQPGGLEKLVNSWSSLQKAGVTGIDANGLLVVSHSEDEEEEPKPRRESKRW